MNPINTPECISPETKHIPVAKYRKRGHDNLLFYAAAHEGFEILHIVEGHGHFIYDNHFFELRPSRLFLVNGSRFHYSNPDNPMEYIRNGVEFSQSDLIQILSVYNQSDMLEPFLYPSSTLCCIDLDEGTHASIDAIFQTITRELSQGELGCIPVAMGHVIQIIALALRKMHQGSSMDASWNITERHVVEIISYVEKKLAVFSLDQMAHELSLSKYHMCHLFKKSTGLTIQNYVLARRLDKARYLLSTSNASISEISESLGFSSFSLFSRCFRQANHMTPREYRRTQSAQMRISSL